MSTPREWLSISGLLAAQHCPASPATSEGEPRVSNGASLDGTAAHAARENQDLGQAPNSRFEALTRGANPDRVETLVKNASPRPAGSSAEVEVVYTVADTDGMPLHTIIGHIDSLSLHEGRPPESYPEHVSSLRYAIVHDDKTGNPDNEVPIAEDPRMHCYGLAVRDAYAVDAVLIRKQYLQLAESPDAIVECWITPENADSHRRWIDEVIVKAHEQRALPPERRDYRTDPTYKACLGCAGSYRCPGFRKTMDRSIAFFQANTRFPLDTDEQVIELYTARSWINAAANKGSDIGKALLHRIEQSGPIVIDGDYHLDINRSGNVARLRRPPLQETDE